MIRLFLGVVGSVLLFSSLLTLHSSPVAGQEPKKDEPKKEPEPKQKTMTIRWFGQSFFQIETANKHLFAIDPHAIPAFGRKMVKADFVIVSHPHDDHSLIEMIDVGVDPVTKELKKISENDVYRGVTETKTGKQDWKTIEAQRGDEKAGIKIRNVATYHDTQNGLTRGKNSVFLVTVDGLTICHLGDLGHELTDAQVKAIGKVDILMIPIGGIYTINGEQALAVMKQLKPRLFVLPMHYGVPGYDDLAGPEEFLEGIPKDQVKKTPTTNELTFPIDIKPEKPTVVVLGWEKKELQPPKDPKDPPKKQ
jgi:L-ascorbate metabolism protein UlaG (beta-lactamase superfamily)